MTPRRSQNKKHNETMSEAQGVKIFLVLRWTFHYYNLRQGIVLGLKIIISTTLKMKGSSWTQHVTATYHKGRKKTPNYKFLQAMKDAKKTYTKKKHKK
eukprot:SAG22_NODE_403_length_11012_cov_12.141024_4_plen_98_part_00